MSRNSFLLTKWYLDCVAENGDALILYVVDLHWNAVAIHYGSVLTVLGGKVGSVSSLRSGSFPETETGKIAVSLPHLDVDGTWKALRSPISKTFLEEQQGSVEWRCLQPMSHVEVSLGGTTRLSGLGYAECLTLSILPWKLPLHELHWGRFLSEQDAIVWVDWRGPHNSKVVVHNGQECGVHSLTESEIVFADSASRLQLDRGLVLRRGRLQDTVFSGIARLAKLLPRTMLAVDECKWRSRGVLHTPERQRSGWAIHEVVKWRE